MRAGALQPLMLIHACVLVMVVTEASVQVSGPRPALMTNFHSPKRMSADPVLWAGHVQRLKGGAETQVIPVNFQVEMGDNEKDVDVYVVGSTETLGSWRHEKSSPMTKCLVDGVEVYSKQVPVRRGEQLEFKFLTISKEDKVQAWESIENRQLVIDHDSARGTVLASFDNPEVKVFLSLGQVGAALVPAIQKKATAPLKRGDTPPQRTPTPLDSMAQVSEHFIGAAAGALRSATGGAVCAVTSAVTIGAEKIGSIAVSGAEKVGSAAKVSAEKIGSIAVVGAEKVGSAAKVSAEKIGSIAVVGAEKVGSAAKVSAEKIGSIAVVGAEKVGSAAKVSAEKIGAAAAVSVERVGSAVSAEKVGGRFKGLMQTLSSVRRLISGGVHGAAESATKAFVRCVHKAQQVPIAVGSAAHLAKDVATMAASEARSKGTLLFAKVEERRKALKLRPSVGATWGLGLAVLAVLSSSSNQENNKAATPSDTKGRDPIVSVSALSLMMGGILSGAKQTAKQELEVQGAITAKTLGGVTAGSVIVGSALRSASWATKLGRRYRMGFSPALGAINTGAATSTGSGVSRFVQESMSAARGVARAASAGTMSYLEQVNAKTKIGHVTSYLEQLESQRIASTPSRAAAYLDQLEIQARSSQTLSRAADAAKHAGSAMEARAVAVVEQSASKLVPKASEATLSASKLVPKAAETRVAGGELMSIIKSLIKKIRASGFKNNIKQHVKRLARFLLRLKFKA